MIRVIFGMLRVIFGQIVFFEGYGRRQSHFKVYFLAKFVYRCVRWRAICVEVKVNGTAEGIVGLLESKAEGGSCYVFFAFFIISAIETISALSPSCFVDWSGRCLPNGFDWSDWIHAKLLD